jgi:hypothetical protein
MNCGTHIKEQRKPKENILPMVGVKNGINQIVKVNFNFQKGSDL